MTQQSSFKGGQPNRTAAVTQEDHNSASGAMREVTDQVKDTAGEIASQAQQAARPVVDQARQQVSSRLAGQKDRAAEGLTSVAQALRQTGQELRKQDELGVTSYIDRAVSQVERLSSYLQDNEIGQLVDDVEQFARRQPALFLGGAFVLGLLGARFLKSSRPYSGPAGSSRGGRSMTQQEPYYTGYPVGADIRGARAVSNYGPGAQSGPHATTGRSTTGQSPSYGFGPRIYNRRREE